MQVRTYTYTHSGTQTHTQAHKYNGTQECTHVCLQAQTLGCTHTGKLHMRFPPLASIRKEEIVLKARAAVAPDQVAHKADHLKSQAMEAAVYG